MKRNLSMAILFVFHCLLFISIPISHAEADRYVPTKIKVGDYKLQNGKPVSGKYSVRWWDLEPFHIAVDDNHKFYVLDIYRKKVLLFMPDGKLVKEITLRGISFPYTNRTVDDGYMYYMIQVSSDGHLMYVTSGSNEYSWTIFDYKGTPIKKNLSILTLFNRVCNDRFVTDAEVLDRYLNIVREVTKHVYDGELFDSTYNFYSLGQSLIMAKPVLLKMDANRRSIWKKEIIGHNKAIRLLGVDGEDNVYILMDAPRGLIKMNKNGDTVTSISLPNDPLLSGDKFVKGLFRVMCDGTIYYFPPYLPLLFGPMQKNGGEYAIYKFELLKAQVR